MTKTAKQIAALISIVLVITLLPAMLVNLDKLIAPKKKTKEEKDNV